MTIPLTGTGSAPHATPEPPLFNTVLVANRGEIACRVIRTLRTLGIRSVAVYSDADAGARHVREADAAVRIGPAAAIESYLKIEAILQACRDTGAEAVHPGYGFLSENADFARALDAAGITFIGPGVDSLNVMGDKIRSKNHVAGYGVPVVPGIAEPGMSDAQLIEAAPGVGFPLLIKPSAGGGGKGMHSVEDPAELASTLATARRVAASAFGDDTLFLERLVTTPRHIEVQILADNHGNVIHLGERECSLQRRHQKVIEEAPSPLLEALNDGGATRARIGEAACNAARSVNYSGAGTVEFLVSDNAPDEFFFMEMNTRLQVEHPVTEMVTGVDLVEWQVRIAAGEALTVAQDDVVLTGHAVEARIYAEIPERNFLPSIGRVVVLDELPDAANGKVRVDSSLLEGMVISSSYDPMIAKVIAWGEDRSAALDTLDRALAGYTALGIDTNVEYLRLLINDADVRAGRLDTGLIGRKMPDFTFRHPGDFEIVAAALFALATEQHDNTARPAGPWQRRDGWRLGADAPRRVSLGVPDGGVAAIEVSGVAGQGAATVTINGGPQRKASLRFLDRDHAELTLDGEARVYSLVRASSGPVYAGSVTPGGDNPTPGAPTELFLGNEGWSCRLELLTREKRLARVLAAVERVDGAADPAVRSPMPGTVVSVAVGSGDQVQAGQVLLSVEAMKMEHQLLAPLAGTVHLTLSLSPGDLVAAGQVLATIHPATDAPHTATAGEATAQTKESPHGQF
ncbi:biotin carboxylase N-terminal domain-containing protein [Arthrobacter oryzae]|uniref:biotin carboxylase n=1 Tax=Arthrobacter oryzae TaxID=409290 RepID=A0A3N0C600_9MICC|nr:biotin carboxylase N-terminal domain-containing protein [Arthrobacter oryzae]RNL57591.1 biotin/lipoyl-binding protein [Arthrobacter oryzae]